jgi:tRNA A37 threonylcarbamoyladenosine modification protein TsaB
VAKALVAANGAELWVAGTLTARAWTHRPRGDAEVTVISSAQRGECYLGRFALTAGAVTVRIAPHPVQAVAVTALAAGSAVLVVDLPGEASGTAGLVAPTGALIIGRPASSPTGLPLMQLLAVAGGTTRVDHPDEWEPTYGRPAEAQARWELAHGRTLPHSPGCAE